MGGALVENGWMRPDSGIGAGSGPGPATDPDEDSKVRFETLDERRADHA